MKLLRDTNGIKLLRWLDMRFALGMKPGGHGHLFEWVDAARNARTFEAEGANGLKRRYRYLNGVPLNDANFELLECRETRPGGKERCFSLEIT